MPDAPAFWVGREYVTLVPIRDSARRDASPREWRECARPLSETPPAQRTVPSTCEPGQAFGFVGAADCASVARVGRSRSSGDDHLLLLSRLRGRSRAYRARPRRSRSWRPVARRSRCSALTAPRPSCSSRT